MTKEKEFDGYFGKYLKVEQLENGMKLTLNSEDWKSPVSIELDDQEANDLVAFIMSKKNEQTVLERKVEIINHTYRDFIGLTGIVTKEDDIQYFVVLDNNQPINGGATAIKEFVKFIK